MAVVDDIWEHAQNTRMWLQTAHGAVHRVPRQGFGAFLLSMFTRGQSRYAGAEEALDAIGKARLSYLDLENSLHRAGHTPVPLQTFALSQISGDHIHMTVALMQQLRTTLTNDLAALDALSEEAERLQQQARAPLQR